MWKQSDIGQNIDDQSGNRSRNQQVCFLAEQCMNFEHEVQTKDKETQKYDRHQVAGSTVRIGSQQRQHRMNGQPRTQQQNSQAGCEPAVDTCKNLP